MPAEDTTAPDAMTPLMKLRRETFLGVSSVIVLSSMDRPPQLKEAIRAMARQAKGSAEPLRTQRELRGSPLEPLSGRGQAGGQCRSSRRYNAATCRAGPIPGRFGGVSSRSRWPPPP